MLLRDVASLIRLSITIHNRRASGFSGKQSIDRATESHEAALGDTDYNIAKRDASMGLLLAIARQCAQELDTIVEPSYYKKLFRSP